MPGTRMAYPAALILTVLLFRSGLAAGVYISLAEAEPVPAGLHLLHYPQDRAVLELNPPGFTWTAYEQAASYRLVLYRGGRGEELYLSVADLRSTVAALDAPLGPGEYSWLVVYRDRSGKPLGRSRLRSFAVGEGLETLAMPDLGLLREKLQGLRPRVFLTPGQLTRIREAVDQGRSPFWELCRGLADLALEEELYLEPAPYKDGVFEVSEWRRIYTPGKAGSAHAVRLALVWKITGEDRYLEAAKKWLVHLAGWDPRGTTSHNLKLPDGSTGNDEASMPMLERLAVAYDWLAGELSPREKELVLGSLRERGDQVLEVLQQHDFLSNPWSNHEGRVLAFLGLAGLSLLGELPEAEAWLDYVLRSYLTSYPSWGGDDGGWAQGLSYWSAYVFWLTGFADALREAAGIDLYRKPFFRNNGYFAVYFHPPYAPRGGFGDHGEAAPNLIEKLLLQKYARTFHDPVLLWQAENIRYDDSHLSRLQVLKENMDWKEWFMEDVVAVINAVPAGFRPLAPEGLPRARWLRDIGWVAVHSGLGDAESDVWVLFKSSRFGSWSHSHADQNSFQVNAFGRALLIDSGYYPWYGSPHHNLWTRQARAHNAVLINGRGQASSSMAARGRIERFEQAGPLTVATGECAAAYNIPQDNGVLEQWRQYLQEPVPPMEPQALTVRRTLVFSGGGGRPWIAVHDYLKTAGPARFDYLLHALEQMELDQENSRVYVRSGEAGLEVRLLAGAGLEFSQSGKFPVPPEERYEGSAEQWHFSARTSEPADEMRFLVLMLPARVGDPPVEVEELDYEGLRGFRVGGEKVLAWWGEGETGELDRAGGQGRMVVEYLEDGELKQKLVK
ncbi:MAG: DUF4962 domain-containing protein [Candidatus Glassbacteria bacterium]|nr:DUF4962 domain-containing protein [Candidatus Glassbacteria bacterium]